MALIKCKECDGKVSSEAKCCPHCGYPIKNKQTDKKTIEFKGKTFDVDNIVSELLSGRQADAYCDIVEEICINVSPYEPNDADDVMYLICQKYQIKNVNLATRDGKFNNVPQCPICKSQNIERIGAMTRGMAAGLFGLFSSTARSQFICKSCGYKF